VVEHGTGRELRFTGTCSPKRFAEATKSLDWYHSFSFDNGLQIAGDYDIGADIEDYGFPLDLTGARVLDVGAASGWISFYFEQLGAEVTAFDARSVAELDEFGSYDRRPWPEDDWMESFGVMATLIGSSIERVRGRVYELSPEFLGGKKFDLVFMGAVLPHLRDPIGALMAARSVCSGRLVATNWFAPAEGPAGQPNLHEPAEGYPMADLPAQRPCPSFQPLMSRRLSAVKPVQH